MKNGFSKVSKCLRCAHAGKQLGALLFALFTIAVSNTSTHAQAHPAPVRSVTVPFVLTDNRVFIDLTLLRKDGTARTARFWVDTGGGGFLLAEPLARDLGLDLSGALIKEGDSQFVAVKIPGTRLANMPLNMARVRASVLMGKKTIQSGIDAEGLLPGHLLAQYQVVFDYPGRKFTLALPGTLKMSGMRLITPIGKRSGFPRLEAVIDGKPYGFLLDTGAAYTMVSQTLLDQWSESHPDWPRFSGATGTANMIGVRDVNVSMLRIPEFQLGEEKLKGVGVISRPAGTFEQWMSQMMTAPIVGAIAGNILRHFRVQIDYARGVTYLERTGGSETGGLDCVPVILAPQADGSYIVVGVTKKDDKPLVDGIIAGDKLLRIDDFAVTGKSMGEVFDALRGKPGDVRKLILEHDNKETVVSAPVIHLM